MASLRLRSQSIREGVAHVELRALRWVEIGLNVVGRLCRYLIIILTLLVQTQTQTSLALVLVL